MKYAFTTLIQFAALALVCEIASAQEPDRSTLPIADSAFKGKIGTTFADSTADFPQPVTAPAGAPNVVVVLLDDMGFGQPGTFGGPVPTPGMDRLADQGLRFNRMHTTGICSATRAALLTGRNQHQVGFGTITELATGFPGYNTVWSQSTASVARVLRDNGYSSAAFGKWHNTPDWETQPNGPFNHWPTGQGFDYWYGFHGGETSQYEPQLYRNTLAVEPAKKPEQGYHLTTDLVDDAIAWVSREQAVTPDKPYFLYFAPGAVHAPLHAPREWIDRFKGQFDQGWDRVREETLARQKRLGVVPADTELTPRPAQIPAWDSLSADEKKLFVRHQEVFAGFVAHTDHEVGRLLDTVRALPGGDNTLVIYVTGDNGASAEGSMVGTLNNVMTQNGVPDSVPAQLAKLDEIGGPLHENHYPVGWAWAGSAPFQWMKRVPSHFGATRNGMIVSWPRKIQEQRGLRTQFAHVIDIAPTILTAAGLPAPKSVDGVEQLPMAGHDLSGTFASAKAPEVNTTQYFENGGHRAIYHDGWIASSMQGVPWQLTGSKGFANSRWELYNIDKDFSQAHDLAGQQPEKLKQLQALFDEQARGNQVYPLDDRFVERALSVRPSVVAGRTKVRYVAGINRIPEGSALPIYQRSHSITANLVIPEHGAEGVILAEGGSAGGFALYVRDGRLHYDYNFFGKTLYRVSSSEPLPKGKVQVRMQYEQAPFRFLVEQTGGQVALWANGRRVGAGVAERVVPVRFSATETLDVGMDLGAPASPVYREQLPYAFTGTLEDVTVEISPTRPLIK
ncbi:arylsulfatase [Pseudomonas alkylphenolica]|uniref:Sulfatase n=1 Tax=Pseudomonas alkylphenolica TaxID=237609 RepID=A0A077FB10_9PSED|nr:arylsulfatase [Pseudomonas alkylphenolica]AIL61765.1 sulfatase [Pseudomonas alkylphenolica]